MVFISNLNLIIYIVCYLMIVLGIFIEKVYLRFDLDIVLVVGYGYNGN